MKKHLSEQENRVEHLSQKIRGETADVWQWIKSKKPQEEPLPIEEGLTECLKLRNFFITTKFVERCESKMTRRFTCFQRS